jgi:hypothetical protein
VVYYLHSQLPVETCTCSFFISRLDRFYLCFCSSYSATCRNMHLFTLPVFNGVRVTQCLVLSVCFVDRGLSFCSFSFGHCVVGSSSIYRFWLPLWYLQTLLAILINVSYAHLNIAQILQCFACYSLNICFVLICVCIQVL